MEVSLMAPETTKDKTEEPSIGICDNLGVDGHLEASPELDMAPEVMMSQIAGSSMPFSISEKALAESGVSGLGVPSCWGKKRVHSRPPPKKKSNVLMSMKVSKESQEPADFKFAPKSRLGEFRPRMDEFRSAPSIKLFSSRPLGIFPADLKPSDASKSSVLNIWDSALDREKAIAITRYPRHYFEELIQWTEQRKLWPFPIDNEMGMEEEKSYTFADHIFLERHLKEWCPTRGPVRHFMELVCVGLSKNHYMTVPRKLAHIEWFRSFLQSKEEILKETGAI